MANLKSQIVTSKGAQWRPGLFCTCTTNPIQLKKLCKRCSIAPLQAVKPRETKVAYDTKKTD